MVGEPAGEVLARALTTAANEGRQQLERVIRGKPLVAPVPYANMGNSRVAWTYIARALGCGTAARMLDQRAVGQTIHGGDARELQTEPGNVARPARLGGRPARGRACDLARLP